MTFGMQWQGWKSRLPRSLKRIGVGGNAKPYTECTHIRDSVAGGGDKHFFVNTAAESQGITYAIMQNQ